MNAQDEGGDTLWLDQPVKLHSSRNDSCEMSAADCEYRSGKWRYWYVIPTLLCPFLLTSIRYQADHVYAFGTVYYCLAIIVFFAIIHLLSRISTPQSRSVPLIKRLVALYRYSSYKSFPIIKWRSSSLGRIIITFISFMFFTSTLVNCRGK
jgi:hypothetical protein